MEKALNAHGSQTKQAILRRTPSFSPALIVEFLLFGGVMLFLLCTYIGMFSPPVQVLVAVIFTVVGASLFFQYINGYAILLNMRNFILLSVLFWILLDPLQMREGIDEFSYDVIVETLLYVVIFMAMVSVGYFIPPLRKITWAFSRIQEPGSRRQVFWVIIIVYLVGLFPILYYSQGSLDVFRDIFYAGYNQNVDLGWRRGPLGTGRDYFVTILQFFFFSSTFLAAWALKRICQHKWEKIILLFIVASVPTTVYFSGSRRIFAFIAIVLLLYFYYEMEHKKRRYWRFILLLAPIILLWLMQMQMQFRATGFYDMDARIVERRLGYLHRDNNFYWLATAVDVMGKQYSFTGEWPFINFLIHPIPRFFWPGKPVNEGFPFISWKEEGSSLSISVIGEFYIAQGLLGVLVVGLFFGWAARNWDQIVRIGLRGNVLTLIYYMGGVLFFVVGVRSIMDIVTQWYSVGYVIGFFYLLRGRGKRFILPESDLRR